MIDILGISYYIALRWMLQGYVNSLRLSGTYTGMLFSTNECVKI